MNQFQFEICFKFGVINETCQDSKELVTRFRWIFKFFVKIILQVKIWQVKFGGFSENPPYYYPPLFLPATIKPAELIVGVPTVT